MLGGVLLAAHLVLVGWLTLRPLDVPWAAAPNLTPLAGIRDDLAYGVLEAARRIGSSLALLAPLGVLLPLVSGRLAPSPLAAWSSLTRTAAAGALISLVIELLQTAVPGQVVNVDSVLLNTTGVVLAHLAVVPAGRARLRRTRSVREAQESRESRESRAEKAQVSQVSQGRTPRIPRVGPAPWTDVLSAVPREY